MTATASQTPICDLIEDLLSHGLSRDIALDAARKMEASISAKLAGAASNSVSMEEIRKRERERKAAQRARNKENVPGHVPGQKPPHTVSNTRDINKDSKKESESVPELSRDKSGTRPADDWPENYVEQFWSKYPPQRRTEKVKVVNKLALLRKHGKVTWAQLMDGLDRYCQSREVANGYAKGPMPWLNGGCWDDVRETVPQVNGSAPAPGMGTGPRGRKTLADLKREGEAELREIQQRGGLFDNEIDI